MIDIKSIIYLAFMFNIILLRIHLRSYKKLNKQKQSHCRQYYIIAESDDKSLKKWIKLNV